MYARLAGELERVNHDPDVRVVLLCGHPGAFCAGNDIADFVNFESSASGLGDVVRFLKVLVELDKPLVAAVDGLAVGIGTTVLLHCDLAYATSRSVFHTPFVDLGLVPEAGSSLLAPRTMGHTQAFALLVLGNSLKVEEALRAGLLTAVADDAEEFAKKAATSLSLKPPEALRMARRLLRGDPTELQNRIEEEACAFEDRLRSTEARTAFAAFLRRK